MLAVRLTNAGTQEIKKYIDEAHDLGVDERSYVLERIQASTTKFYYQVPFIATDTDECVVVDYRQKDQVENRLKDFASCKDVDLHWL